MAFSLKQLASGMFSRLLLNNNFNDIENEVNNNLLHRQGTGSSVMKKDLDMDSNDILNIGEIYKADGDPFATISDVTKAETDSIARDSTLQSNIDAEEAARQSADSNLQSQISGGLPLEASAFSAISWHDQIVENSVTIPPNKNAWSFGPTITVAVGQSITIGAGSFYTVANGQVV